MTVFVVISILTIPLWITPVTMGLAYGFGFTIGAIGRLFG